MPIAISVNFDVARFADRLDAVAAKQVPFATARALTDVAKLAQAEVTGDLPKIFDRPTPFTMKGLSIQSATKTTLASTVFIKPIQAQYLLHEEIGGTRLPSENTRKAASALILPSKIERDQFGGIPSGAIKALRQTVAEEKSGRTRKNRAQRAASSMERERQKLAGHMTEEGALWLAGQRSAPKGGAERLPYLAPGGIAYITGRGPKGGPGGFFMRLAGHKIMRLTGFEGSATYKERFHYRDRVTAIARSKFTECLIKRLREAIADG